MSTCTAPVVHTDIKALAAEPGRPAGITRPRTFILRPALNRHGKRLHGRFVAILDGRQLCVSRQPLLDAARILIKQGIDPATPIATRHAGAGFDAMTSTAGAAARWTVKENEIQSPHFVRWEAFPASRVRPSLRQNERPVPDPVFGAGRIHGRRWGAA